MDESMGKGMWGDGEGGVEEGDGGGRGGGREVGVGREQGVKKGSVRGIQGSIDQCDYFGDG